MIRRAAALVLFALSTACSNPGSVSTTRPSPTPTPPAVVAIRIIQTPSELPTTGGTAELRIETVADVHGTTVAPNVLVELAASSGELSETHPRTDSTGHAKVTWTGTGAAEITAHAGDVSLSAPIHFVTVVPPLPPGPGPTPPAPVPPVPPPGPTPAPTPTVSVTLTADPASVLIGETVTLTAVATTNADAGGIRSFAWDFDGDGIFDPAPNASTVTTSYSTAGVRTIHVRAVSTSWVAADATTTVSVNTPPPPPQPALILTITVTPAAPQPAGTPLTISVTVTPASGPMPAGPFQYEWDFNGDGTIDQPTSTNNVMHAYTVAGTYTLKVRVTAPNGQTGSNQIAIGVN